MTHSLHRHGDTSSLKRDFVVLTLENRHRTSLTWKDRLSGRFPRFYTLLKTVYRKLGVGRLLNRAGVGDGLEGMDWTSVFHSREDLRSHLARLKEADTGRSVVVSGVIDEVGSCLGDLGLRPHTVQYSLGSFGRLEQLPDKTVLEVTTMCGHHLVSPRFVEKKMREVADGQVTNEAAAESLGELCLCKIFNKRRAAALLEDHANRS